MLNEILAAIPRVLAAALWIGIAFIAARFLKTIIEAILPPTGFDQAILLDRGPARERAAVADRRQHRDDRDHPRRVDRSGASSWAATTIAIFLAQVTALGGKVIFGTLIIVVGIFLARIIANLVGSGTGEGGYAQTIVRYAIIALFTAIGLTFMGLADQIVMMAFGLILGSAAIATALAFGLGGRDAAARIARALGGRSRDRPRRRPPPRRIRSAPATRRQPAASGVSDDLRRGRRLRADAARYRAFDQLRQAGGQGRIERPRVPVPEP